MSRLSLRNPLLTAEQIAQSPSQKSGMAGDQESNLRAYGCHLLESTGIILGVPQVVMASAQILFQRFYYLASFQEFPLRGIALGSLFLACKVEEHPQSIRNIINVLDIVVKRDRGYPEEVTDGYDAEYYDLKNELVIAELQILRRLGFNVQVELPYGLLVNYLRSLEATENQKLCQLAWNYLNDLLRTPVYVCFQPETIACGAIYLAAHACLVRLPESPSWWSVFDANGQDVITVAKAIRAVYLRKWPSIAPLDEKELGMYMEGTLGQYVERVRVQRWNEKKMKDKEADDVDMAVIPDDRNGREKGIEDDGHREDSRRSRRRSGSRTRSRSRSGSRRAGHGHRRARSPSPHRSRSRVRSSHSHHHRIDDRRSRESAHSDRHGQRHRSSQSSYRRR